MSTSLCGLMRPTARSPQSKLQRRCVLTLDLLERLRSDLIATDSATETLRHWCKRRGIAPDPKINARVVERGQGSISEAIKRRLMLERGDAMYRRVDLICGDRTLSEAKIWYAPSRLTPQMNELLGTTDTPFGAVVKDLLPRRKTIRVRRLWKAWRQAPGALSDAERCSEMRLEVPLLVLELSALVTTSENQPIAAVVERYRRDLFNL